MENGKDGGGLSVCVDEVSTAPRMGEMGWDGMADRRGPRDPPCPDLITKLERSWTAVGAQPGWPRRKANQVGPSRRGESSFSQVLDRVEDPNEMPGFGHVSDQNGTLPKLARW